MSWELICSTTQVSLQVHIFTNYWLFDPEGQWTRNTRCMPGYKLLCLREFLSKNGVVMRPRRANGQNAAFGSHRPSISCHVGRPRTHTIVQRSQIYVCRFVSSPYCEANQLAPCCVQLGPPARWEVSQYYQCIQYTTTSLYLVYT